MIALVIIVATAVVVLVALSRAIRIVPQARAYVVERLGSYNRTLSGGFNTLVPGVDRVRSRVDLREQVVSFDPQPVITEDNLVVHIDTVLYFQVTDPRAATYEIANYLLAIEQLTVTTLRNVIGGMDLERTLTSREEINGQLRGVLDEATGKWGIRVNRVELKAIDPPKSIIDAMEKQLRAERDKRATILTAEGLRQSQILTAEGAKQSAILTAEGQAKAQVLMADGQAKAIDIVFSAIHDGRPDPELLAYQYLQVLPKIAEGNGSQIWMIPSELTKALEGFASAFRPPATSGPASEPNGPPMTQVPVVARRP
jgi:regulator of protease activity HflC (stomatin/prohibitin superfamily)